MSSLDDAMRSLRLGGLAALNKELEACSNQKWYQVGLEETGAREVAMSAALAEAKAKGYSSISDVGWWAKNMGRAGWRGARNPDKPGEVQAYSSTEFHWAREKELKRLEKARTWRVKE